MTAAQRRYAESFARTETAGNNLFYTLNETLNYANETQRYLLGAASRRDVQVKRSLLAQRLTVVGGTDDRRRIHLTGVSRQPQRPG